MKEKYKCPVCGKYDFEFKGDFEICPICLWQNDDYLTGGGANLLSLEQARLEYMMLTNITTQGRAKELQKEFDDKQRDIYSKRSKINHVTQIRESELCTKELDLCIEEYMEKLNKLKLQSNI